MDLLRPRWARDPRLLEAGFTPRGVDGPAAAACRQQVHGATVHVWAGEDPAEGDGLWRTGPGCVAVRVADCVPILLHAPDVDAVAAVHAGWRGTAADIVGEAVRVGRSLGAAPGRLRAAIGPCICADHFEVGDEVVAALRAVGLPDAAFGLRAGRRPHVDLRRANRALLVRAGVPDGAIEDVAGCTWERPDLESYRRDGAAAGRMRAVIGLRG